MNGTKTAIIWREEYLEHRTGMHPERSERLTAIRERLLKTSYYAGLAQPRPRVASHEEIALIHDPAYIAQLEESCEKKKMGFIDSDTPFSQGTYSAASLAVGAGLTLSDLVWKGEIERGLALVRPPGHHALEDTAMGFCFFNNIAVTAKYLKSLGARKILILDWDVHHGNGTQDVFYEDDSVFFVSLHQFPYYPGTGSAGQAGRGQGTGYTLNCPLPRGSVESDYLECFQEKIFPAWDAFCPEIVLISAGFDAHRDDPLGGMELGTSAFETFTRLVVDKAREHSQGRILSFLEGGYDLHALAESVEVHASVLATA